MTGAVSISDIYFLNINFTWAARPTISHPASWVGQGNAAAPGDATWDDLTGGCLRIVSTTLSVNYTYFYQVLTNFPGGAIFCATVQPPTFEGITLRSQRCVVEKGQSQNLDEGFYGHMIYVAAQQNDVAKEPPSTLNSSRVLDSFAANAGSYFGGIAWVNVPFSVLVHGVNVTRVNGDHSDGLLLSGQNDARLTVEYSLFSNCSNAYGIVVFQSLVVNAKVDMCNFVHQKAELAAIFVLTYDVNNPPTLTVSNSVIDTDVRLVGIISYDTGNPLKITVAKCQFSNAANLLAGYISGTAGMQPITVPTDGVTCNVALAAMTTAAIDSDLANIPMPSLTVTLAFTESQTFSPLGAHATASVYAAGTGTVSAGVLATIFGILSLIMFLFLIYLRRGSAATYHLIGRFQKDLEFDGVEAVVPYDEDQPDKEYTYSVSYEYYYDSDNDAHEEKPQES
jgi:hypothetical protein